MKLESIISERFSRVECPADLRPAYPDTAYPDTAYADAANPDAATQWQRGAI